MKQSAQEQCGKQENRTKELHTQRTQDKYVFKSILDDFKKEKDVKEQENKVEEKRRKEKWNREYLQTIIEHLGATPVTKEEFEMIKHRIKITQQGIQAQRLRKPLKM